MLIMKPRELHRILLLFVVTGLLAGCRLDLLT